MEYSPRALVNRSLLGDARNLEMQKKPNIKIKYREDFRQFKPSTLIESSREFFDVPVASTYMLLIADVIEEERNKLPENFHEMDL
jgi:carbamoyltransferase